METSDPYTNSEDTSHSTGLRLTATQMPELLLIHQEWSQRNVLATAGRPEWDGDYT